jgi:predicted RNase H-like HicB family nuclease
MHRYLIVLEPTATGFSAYSPDLPGCVATGASRPEAEGNMRDAIVMHLEGMREDGHAAPTPQAIGAYVEVAA